MEVELKNLGTANKNQVILTSKNFEVNLFFSYSTLVAVNDAVSENKLWSATTEKLLNDLQPDKKKRVPHAKVLEEAKRLIKMVVQDDYEAEEVNLV
jgi:hypothetical protein